MALLMHSLRIDTKFGIDFIPTQTLKRFIIHKSLLKPATRAILEI